MLQKLFTSGLLLTLMAANSSTAATLRNLGLVGVGRIPANTLDATGNDTLGGVFSGMSVDSNSVVANQGVWTFLLDTQPDRGFGASADYHPRLHQFQAQISPYYGATPAAQNQINLTLHASDPYTVLNDFFTGAGPDDLSSQSIPRSLASSAGGGKLTLDPEGLAILPNDERYAADEYGPYIYHFSAQGKLLAVLSPPAAYIPKVGPAYPRPNNFLAAMNAATDSGRFENRGFEGLTITPDGTRLVTILQSPLVQDGANKNAARNTRVLVFDIAPGSPTYRQPVAEYVYTLTLNGNAAGTRATVVSDILALTATDFLILERDAIGLGGDPGTSVYKSVVLASTVGATDILNSNYDLERGAPGQLSLPRSGLPASIQPMARTDVINLLDPAQLSRFNLGNSVTRDANSLSEKWEGMAVVPLNDPDAPEDYLLLIGNDNDFSATPTFHNGVAVGSALFAIDSMIQAWRIGRAPYLKIAAQPTLAAGENCSAQLPDLRGAVTIIDHTAPPLAFTLTQSPASGTELATGSHNVSIQAEAANGYITTITTEVVVSDLTAPVFVDAGVDHPVLWPPNNQLVPINVAALVTDNCDSQPRWRVVEVTSNEPAPSDTLIVSATEVALRAKRNGSGSDRIYTIVLEATDAAGNTSTQNVAVRVPHDQSN